MKTNDAFSPVNEKVVSGKVVLMSWSPKFDLLSVATESGKLLLFRLVPKEKVWVIPGPDSETKIRSISWKPDGKVIAVSYSKNKHGIQFICMETKAKLRKFSLGENQLASLLNWLEVDSSKIGYNVNEEPTGDDFLPKVPLWEFEPGTNKKKAVQEPEASSFSVLYFCDDLCRIFFLANGMFPIMMLHCAGSHINTNTILAMHLSPKMDTISVAMAVPVSDYNETKSIQLGTFNLSTLTENVEVFWAVAAKAREILSLESYLGEILSNVAEQCELVSQDMETHLISYLVKYAATDAIGDDLMQLLMWGKATDGLINIFTNHVTKREIKKLMSLIESTYTKIQQDLTLNFQTALMNLYYHLTEVKGIVSEAADVVPLHIEDMEDILAVTGSLMFKTAELLQVIDSSLKNFNAFFRWLYISMVKIQNEPSDKLVNVSSSEMIFVADFIHEHFKFQKLPDSKSGRQFQLEKVYQYLKNEDLSLQSKISQNEWLNFVSSNSSLSNSKIIIKPLPEKSLRQVFNALSEHLENFIRLPRFSDTQAQKVVSMVELLHSAGDDTPNVVFWTKTPPKCIVVANEECYPDGTYILAAQAIGKSTDARLYHLDPGNSLNQMKCIQLNFESDDSGGMDDQAGLTICDFQAFDKNAVTVLLKKQTLGTGYKCYLTQMNLSALVKILHFDGLSCQSTTIPSFVAMNVPTINAVKYCSDARELNMKRDFVMVAASGNRKVSCVLAKDMRTIYPFLMDATEEDDDEDDDDFDDDILENQ